MVLVDEQTRTQAERKILEAKREALIKEARETRLSCSLQEKLAEIDSMKLQPYGAFDAVRFLYSAFHFYIYIFQFSIAILFWEFITR